MLVFGISAVLISIVSTIFSFYPIENQFMSFESVEDAFEYRVGLEPKKIVEGENSALVVYDNEESENLVQFYYKSEDGYTLPDSNTWNIVHFSSFEDLVIHVHKINNTQDYYLVMSEGFMSTSMAGQISDNLNTDFVFVDGKHFAYVKDLDDDYELIIDGIAVPIEQNMA